MDTVRKVIISSNCLGHTLQLNSAAIVCSATVVYGVDTRGDPPRGGCIYCCRGHRRPPKRRLKKDTLTYPDQLDVDNHGSLWQDVKPGSHNRQLLILILYGTYLARVIDGLASSLQRGS